MTDRGYLHQVSQTDTIQSPAAKPFVTSRTPVNLFSSSASTKTGSNVAADVPITAHHDGRHTTQILNNVQVDITPWLNADDSTKHAAARLVFDATHRFVGVTMRPHASPHTQPIAVAIGGLVNVHGFIRKGTTSFKPGTRLSILPPDDDIEKYTKPSARVSHNDIFYSITTAETAFASRLSWACRALPALLGANCTTAIVDAPWLLDLATVICTSNIHPSICQVAKFFLRVLTESPLDENVNMHCLPDNADDVNNTLLNNYSLIEDTFHVSGPSLGTILHNISCGLNVRSGVAHYALLNVYLSFLRYPAAAIKYGYAQGDEPQVEALQPASGFVLGPAQDVNDDLFLQPPEGPLDLSRVLAHATNYLEYTIVNELEEYDDVDHSRSSYLESNYRHPDILIRDDGSNIIHPNTQNACNAFIRGFAGFLRAHILLTEAAHITSLTSDIRHLYALALTIKFFTQPMPNNDVFLDQTPHIVFDEGRICRPGPLHYVINDIVSELAPAFTVNERISSLISHNCIGQFHSYSKTMDKTSLNVQLGK